MGNEYSKKILNNASWLIASKIIQAGLSFLIGTISAQYLGPSNYGLISYATSIVTFLVPITQLGMRHTLVQEIVNNPSKEGEILGTTLGMTMISSFVGIIGMVLFVSIANSGDKVTIMVCSLYSVTLVFQSLELIEYWFQAKWLAKYTSITALIAYTVVSIYRVTLLVTEKSVYWFALSHALDYLIISIVLLVIYKKIGKKSFKISFLTAKKLFSKSRHYIISDVMVCLYTQTDHIMLTLMLGNSTNGIYNAALTCANISGFIFAAIIDSARPAIFQSKKQCQQQFEKNISRLYSIIIYLSLAQCIVVTILAKPMIDILYGTNYSEAIVILRILTWYPTFSYMGTVRNIWMLSEEKQKLIWKINMSGAVINIVGNAILIPLCGAVGAALATIGTQVVTNFLLCYIFKNIRYNLKLIKNGANPIFMMNELKYLIRDKGRT